MRENDRMREIRGDFGRDKEREREVEQGRKHEQVIERKRSTMEDGKEKMRGNAGNQSGGKNRNQEREGDIISARLKNSFQGRRRDNTEREGWRKD